MRVDLGSLVSWSSLEMARLWNLNTIMAQSSVSYPFGSSDLKHCVVCIILHKYIDRDTVYDEG